MHLDTYPIEISDEFLTFDFYSVGPKGKIRKKIVFQELDKTTKLYNVGFGDVDQLEGIDDEIISGNNDSKKIFSTVAVAVNMFFEKKLDCLVYAIGSTGGRTRLYRIAIGNSLSMIIINYDVFGFNGYQWELFKKDKNYEAFLIKRKDNNFKL